MTRQLRIAVLSGLFLLPSLATVRSVRAQSPPAKKPPQPVSDQITNIPYFTLRDAMSSTLTLQNLAPTPTKITVTIFNTDGRAHVLDPMTLDPHSVKEVELEDVVPREDFDSGNIEVAFNGIPMVVTCQVSVFSLKNRVSFESREEDMMDFESANLAGILSLPKGADGFLAVTNVAKNRLTFQLTAGSLKKTVALFPRETELIKLNEDELAAPTLIKLQHNGMPGDVITTGYVLNLKDGYSSGFAMLDPGINRSRTLAGAHFRAGKPDPREGFPGDTRFRSPLLLANVSANPVVAHVSVDYTVREKVQMTPVNPNDANATEDKFNTIAVKTLRIAPGDVQRVELSDALGGVGQIAEAGVDIAYDAASGSIIGQLTSVDQTGDYAFEVPVKDPAAISEQLQSIYPWTLKDGANTVLHLKNTTDQTAVGLLLFDFYDHGIFKTYNPDRIVLQPYQTIAIDIQKLKDSKKPDVRGELFPADVMSGQAQWHQVTPYSMIGRVEETNVKTGMAKSFSCSYPCCTNYYEYEFTSPSSLVGTPGGSGSLTLYQAGANCNLTTFGPYAITPSSWSMWPNTTVANVSAGNVTYLAAGTDNVVTVVYDTSYDYNANNECFKDTHTYDGSSTPVNVNPPDHVKVSTDSQGPPTCSTGTPVDVRRMNMQLVDVNSVNVTTNYSTKELPFTGQSSNTCLNGMPAPAFCFSAGPTQFCTNCGPGQFNDTMAVSSGTNFNYCSTVNPTLLANNCGYTLTSTWAMCSSGLVNSIWTSTRGTFSKNVSVSGNTTMFNPGTIFH